MIRLAEFDGIVHYVGPRSYASLRNDILFSDDGGRRWTPFARLPLTIAQRVKSMGRLQRRLWRAAVHHVVPLSDGALVVFAGHRIYRIDPAGRCAGVSPLRGSRPLRVCIDRGIVYFGEYRANRERSPVHVWASRDGGATWTPVHRFMRARHVHGVFADPHEDALWVTTGDLDREAAIWRTDDGFRAIERVAGGSQQTRAVQLLFTRDYVFYGSDAPAEPNYLYRLRRRDGAIERLQPVEGPVYYGCATGGRLFFSTACEPDTLRRTRDVAVWMSADGERWRRLAGFRKDRWPARIFQHGHVLLPAGPGEPDADGVWLASVATDEDQRSVKLGFGALAGNAMGAPTDGSPPRGEPRPRLLLIGPRIIANDIIGGTQIQFESLVSELQRRARVALALVSTARPLANRGRLGRAGLNATAFLKTLVSTWRQAVAADLVVWCVSPGAAIRGGWGLWLICALRRRPLGICFFGGSFDARLESAPAVWRFIATRTFLKADILLCQTRRLTDTLGESFRTAWLPNTRNMPSRRRPYRPSCRRLLFLSLLQAEKGVPELAAAAARFPDAVRLSVFGPATPGFDAQDVDHAPNVTFGGTVAPARVPAVMEEHDALVLPTRYPNEGYPGVVIEAFQMGLPVIVTRQGGLQELVTDGRDGLCVEAGSVDSLVEAVARVCSNDQLFQGLRKGALETGERYRAARAAVLLEGLCRRAAASGDPRA